jgi:hypothetical protein
MFITDNMISTEAPLYIYICNYLSSVAMIKSDDSCIIYPSQSIGIKNDGTFAYEQCNANIPTVTNVKNYTDIPFSLTYKLYDPSNKYANKNVIVKITPLTVPIIDTNSNPTGYTRTYTFNVYCDPKFTFEIYLYETFSKVITRDIINLRENRMKRKVMTS